MDDCTPMPITRLSISRSLWTSGVKSESPVPIANVVMKLRSYASSIASTAILMSAAFLREPPSRCGISMSSTWARASSRRSSSNADQSAYARRATTRPRSASASATGPKSNGLTPRPSRAPIARFS